MDEALLRDQAPAPAAECRSVIGPLNRAWQLTRSAFALSNQTDVSDLCHEAMREIEVAILMMENR